MVTLCWAAKGGSGTTVATALFALESQRRALLVDLAGEAPTVLGLAEPDRPGVVDWLRGDGGSSQLADLVVDVGAATVLLPCSLAADPTATMALDPIETARWARLVAWLTAWAHEHEGDVWIDAGTGAPPTALVELVDRRWLVTRPCYLSVRRAARAATKPSGVVAIVEEGRTLGTRDIEAALGAPVVAMLPIDPKVARAVDAGLLVSRAPFAVRREIRRLAA